MKGKVAWITGGKRIGQEIAEALLGEGVKLVISYRTSKKETEAFADKALIIQCDVTDRESVAKAVKNIEKEFGRLDILVLLASVFKPVKLEEITEKDWDTNFSAHVKGTFWPIQLSLPLMRPGSHIVTISDRTAIGRVYPGYLPYVVTKAGVASMTKALAAELGPKGIFINSIAPGPVLKPEDISEKDWQAIRGESIIKYPLTDEEAVKEFVDTVLRLCSARSSGNVYPLDFGHL
jgi:NAD(P)-dependent dehydrogenase (short-subunit alcohol dehydrogenase family)